MSEGEIIAFNKKTTRPDIYLTDIVDYPQTIKKVRVFEMADSLAGWARDHARFGHENVELSEEFFSDINTNINRASVPAFVTVRFGMTVAETDLRALPTGEIGMEARSEYEFDQLQESLLSPGTPVAVVWETRDGRWFLIVSPYAAGMGPSRENRDSAVERRDPKISDRGAISRYDGACRRSLFRPVACA
jgi:hypothetical protein